MDRYMGAIESLHKQADRERLIRILSKFPEFNAALKCYDEHGDYVQAYTRADIISMLGISRTHFNDLKSAGYIKPINEVDAKDKFSGAERYTAGAARRGLALWNIQKAFGYI